MAELRSAIEAEILKITQKRRHRINTPDYRKILVESLSDLPKHEWDRLSLPTKIWYNACAQQYEDGGELDNFTDIVGSDDVDLDSVSGPSRAKISRERNKQRKYKGAGYRAKEIMLERGVGIKAKDIHRILRTEGYEYSINTLLVVRAEFRRALALLADRGYLNQKPKGMKD